MGYAESLVGVELVSTRVRASGLCRGGDKLHPYQNQEHTVNLFEFRSGGRDRDLRLGRLL